MGKPCSGLNLPCSNAHKRKGNGRMLAVKATETVVCPRCELTYNYCLECIPKFNFGKVCNACAEQRGVRSRVLEQEKHYRKNEAEPFDPDNPGNPEDPEDLSEVE